jgi:CDP-paratose 2-epimerase
VYGDRPNALPLGELDTRWEVASSHPFAEHGIDETMSIDQSKHSLFGVSKTAADLLVQEYGNYFDMRTVCFRCGCITGPSHAGAQLHGFLSYLVKCAVAGEPYTVFGYKGKQVRDNLHAADLAEGFYQFYLKPRSGEVYNLGGSRENSCSVLEAVTLCEGLTGRRLHTSYVEQNRAGDHIWYISDVRKFSGHYPDWTIRFDLRTIIEQIVQTYSRRTGAPA